ncbi:hypothetical protein BT96DRAFT_923497 [Gymnopus androsaceus JB14]|uniref:Uncharacterized protein n=1 Tax=Gymnopus androsaceus JB14 TaxID=1447944 RepID=A0A6A4H8A0_9AGAR|nr:hypothetical protein BT96DRAFT_923497 [Gymnopus androsaceus JB14]
MIKRHREILSSSSIIMLSLHLALGLFAASFAVSAQTCFPTAPSEPVIIHASPATGWFLDESPTEYIGIILFSATIANSMNITLLDATANMYQIQPYDATATTQCIYGPGTDNGQVFGATCGTDGTQWIISCEICNAAGGGTACKFESVAATALWGEAQCIYQTAENLGGGLSLQACGNNVPSQYYHF